jgi:hypothetical protein
MGKLSPASQPHSHTISLYLLLLSGDTTPQSISQAPIPM